MFWAILITALVMLVFCIKWNFVDFVRSKLNIKVNTLIKFLPILLFMLVASVASTSDLTFVGVAHTNGLNYSVWQSDLFVLPMTCHKPPYAGGNECVVSYTMTGIDKDGETNTISGTVDATVGVPISVTDVYSLLNMTDASGVLLINSPDDISLSWMKTYSTLPDGGTFGQIVLPSQPLTPLATYIAVPSAGRVGLWFYNASSTQGVVKMGDGSNYITLNPGVEYVQFPEGAQALKFIAGALPPWGSGLDPDAEIYLTVTAVDNQTNDGVTVPLWITDSGE